MNLPIDYNNSNWLQKRAAREEYIKRQQGKCLYCGTSLNASPPEKIIKKHINKKLFPKQFFKFPIHLHHGHNSGLTIGAVHSYCNAILWQYHGE